MPILTAAEYQDLWPDVGTSATPARINLIIGEFVEIAEAYRGCIFGTPDPDTDPEWPPTVEPPARLKRAAAEYVTAVLQSERSGQSRDVISQVGDGTTLRYSTPDWSLARPTGWLEVDRLLNSLPDYRLPGIA